MDKLEWLSRRLQHGQIGVDDNLQHFTIAYSKDAPNRMLDQNATKLKASSM